MSCRTGLLVTVVALTLCGSLAVAGTGPSGHLLYPDEHILEGLSIVFVGDGFVEKELPTFGKVVNSFVTDLREQDVFETHQSRFNFYRIDVVDKTGVTKACTGESHFKVTDVPIDGDSDPPVDGTEEMDLGVEGCFDGGNSLIYYTEKVYEANLLAAQIPDLKVIVIVANARKKSGGAPEVVYPADTAVVVVGAHVSPTDNNPAVYEIDGHALAILVHELGHGLGLLDEYDSLNTVAPPVYEECRNVWKPDASPQWPGTPTWPASEKPIPWNGILINCCSPQSMVRCQADPAAGCALQDVEALEAYCSFVPPRGSCEQPPECDLFPGAWEGAFYSPTGYYRAKKECRMKKLGIKQQFCEACREYLDIFLQNYGPSAIVGTWPEDRCLAQGCPVGVPPPPPPPMLPEPPQGTWRSDE